MKQNNDNDLREALCRLEARRPQPEVPAGFCDRVMKQIATQPKASKAKPAARRRLLWTAAAAASIATAVILVWPTAKEKSSELLVQQLPPHQAESQLAGGLSSEIQEERLQTSEPSPCSGEFATHEQGDMNLKIASRSSQIADTAEPVAQAQASDADSLPQLTAAIEEELEQVSDDCYMQHLEQAISSDPQLSRLVDEFINAASDTTQANYHIKSI
ncbi:MAG: hypothetical protein IJT98_10175 [Prevotella sp.]|nr:hypothetical protein [Prevotella sp.]